jgi:hypothetical protein
MYSLIIDGYFAGSFKTVALAMVCVQKKAIPFKSRWAILDPFNRVCAKVRMD